MEIKDAKIRIQSVIERAGGDSQALLRLAISALERSGADYAHVSDRMEALLANESRLNGVPEKFAEDIYIAALAMKRQAECKAYLKDKDKKHVIDGETVSMWTSVISAVLGILATIVVVVLVLFNVIENVDIDRLAYIIGLAGWLVTVVVAAIAKIINRCQTKKHNETHEYTVAELMAAKYEDSPKIVRAFLPTRIKNVGNKNKVKGNYHMYLPSDSSLDNVGNQNVVDDGDMIIDLTKGRDPEEKNG